MPRARAYPEIQLRRLQRIRRLLDRGMRPGKLLPLSEDAQAGLEASLQPAAPQLLNETVTEILDAIRSANAWQVESLIRGQYEKQGMQAFITGTVVPLLRRVGELWIGGNLQVFQEHFLSEQLIRFLNAEISAMQKSVGKPLVVLATLPSDQPAQRQYLHGEKVSPRKDSHVRTDEICPRCCMPTYRRRLDTVAL